MMVGIIDVDLFINRKTFLPNPEVMLLSSYHKKKGDIVHLLLDGKSIDIYEKVYIIRNRTAKVKFPEELYSRHNVSCSGQYFTNGIVAPIDPEVFECTPDKTIYDKYVRYWGDKPIKGVKNLERAKYVSLRKGFPPLTGAGSNYLYDYDLGSREDFEKLNELYEKQYFKKLHFYYPIKCTDVDLAIEWMSAPYISGNTKFIYPNALTWKEIYKLKNTRTHVKFVSYVTNKSRFSSQQEIDELFINTMNKAIYCQVYDIKIQFVINPKIRMTDQYKLIKRLCDWSNSIVQPSFYEFCASTSSVRILAEQFMRAHPEIKDWFYITPYKLKQQGGIWLNDRRTN
jgi:hypothetical protein